MEPKYYVVRTRTNVEKYVKNGVSAVGWSNFCFDGEKTDELCEKIKAAYREANTSERIIGRKIAEIKRIMSIKKGDVILVPTYKGFYGNTAQNFRAIHQ